MARLDFSLCTLRYRLILIVALIIGFLNALMAIGEKKFLKGFILGLIFANKNNQQSYHMSPVYVPSNLTVLDNYVDFLVNNMTS